MREVLTPEQRAELARLGEQGPPELADYPDRERLDLDASTSAMRAAAAASPLRPLPLVVLTHGVPVGADLPPEQRTELPPDFPWDTIEMVSQELQAGLAALVPGARQVIATESGHYIQLDEPELVIEAIRQVVEAVREPSSWATPAASPSPTA